MSKQKVSLLSCFACAILPSLWAEDGTTLIGNVGVLPYLITQPGSYRLSANMTVANSTAIQVTASNVTLDLNGFTISCSACSGSTIGIVVNGTGVTVRNGRVTGFTGPEGAGIIFRGGATTASDIQGALDHMIVTKNTSGVLVPSWSASLHSTVEVLDSTISDNTHYGIVSADLIMVMRSLISNNRCGIGMYAGMVVGSIFVGNGMQPPEDGIYLTGVDAYGNTYLRDNQFSGNATAVYASANGLATYPHHPMIVGLTANTFTNNLQDLVQGAYPPISGGNNVSSKGKVF